jgi:hypothetical protein
MNKSRHELTPNVSVKVSVKSMFKIGGFEVVSVEYLFSIPCNKYITLYGAP